MRQVIRRQERLLEAQQLIILNLKAQLNTQPEDLEAVERRAIQRYVHMYVF
jgi:hypothetical protein